MKLYKKKSKRIWKKGQTINVSNVKEKKSIPKKLFLTIH